MGRQEALVVAALGRSPYDEELVEPEASSRNGENMSTGQQYDERGHPVNLETRQRMKDHVRASNEVMLTAGIIEETVEVAARNKAMEAILDQEREIGRRRLEVGRMILVAGVWGVCGLRRRVLLYKNYSDVGVLELLKRERTVYSIQHIVGAGLPAMATYEFSMMILRNRFLRFISGTNRDNEPVARPSRISSNVAGFVFSYILAHYEIFILLQQVNLLPSNYWLPSSTSLIPFSAHSPLQLPPLPSSISLPEILKWAAQLGINAAPLLAVVVHAKIFTTVTSFVSGFIFTILPKPINRRVADVRPETLSSSDTLVDPSEASQTAALNSLEDQPPTDIVRDLRDDSSDDEGEITQTTLISFDVEATEISETSVGTWSAELRSANETPQSAQVFYHTSTLTMLPPLLAAEGLSWVVTDILLAPIEAQMVRIVARAFRGTAGTADLYQAGMFGMSLPLQGWLNLLTIQYAGLLVTGSIWTAFTVASHVIGGRMKHLSSERKPSS